MPYKIFIGNNILYLCTKGFVLPSDEALGLSLKNTKQQIFKSTADLKDCIEFLENKKLDSVFMLFHDDENFLFDELCSFYTVVLAAGGLVVNAQDELLLIFRKKKWDLPKGKVEEDEEIIDASLREVEEETGISNLTIMSAVELYPWKQGYTFHTYFENRKRVLKKTFWYRMACNTSVEFTPQYDEGITDVKWVSQKEANQLIKNSYASIADVIRYGCIAT